MTSPAPRERRIDTTKRRSAGNPAPAAPPLYTPAEVLSIIPKTKRSQMELLVRTGTIAPAQPSEGTGHDRKFDGRNLFEIAVAAELIALGFVGQRLTRHFRFIMGTILDVRNPKTGEYLALLSNKKGPIPFHRLLSGAELEETIGIFPSVYVLNVRRIHGELDGALEDFRKQRAVEPLK